MIEQHCKKQKYPTLLSCWRTLLHIAGAQTRAKVEKFHNHTTFDVTHSSSKNYDKIIFPLQEHNQSVPQM